MSEQQLAPGTAPETRFEASDDRESIAGLFRRLIDDTTTLIRSEIELARSEVTASVSAAGVGVGLVAVGAMLALAALACVLVAIIVWLADAVGTGLSALIVGGVLAVIAGLLVVVGIGKVKQMSLAPKRTAANLKRDAQMLKGD